MIEVTAAGAAAVASCVTAFVATAALSVGLRQLRLARETREEQTRAYVVVQFVRSETDPVIEVVLSNIGSTPARNVVVSFDPPAPDPVRGDSTRQPFPGRIAQLVPGERVVATYLYVGYSDEAAEVVVPHRVTVTYDYGRKKPDNDVVVLDARYLLEVQRFKFSRQQLNTERSVTKALNELHEIRKELGRIASTVGRRF